MSDGTHYFHTGRKCGHNITITPNSCPLCDHAAEVERLEQRLLDQHHELAGLHEHNAILAERVRVLEEERVVADAVAKDFVNFYDACKMAHRHVNEKSDGTPFNDGYEMMPELGDTLRAFASTRAALAQPQQKEGE